MILIKQGNHLYVFFYLKKQKRFLLQYEKRIVSIENDALVSFIVPVDCASSNIDEFEDTLINKSAYNITKLLLEYDMQLNDIQLRQEKLKEIFRTNV